MRRQASFSPELLGRCMTKMLHPPIRTCLNWDCLCSESVMACSSWCTLSAARCVPPRSAEEPALIDLAGVEGMLREIEIQVAELSMYEEGYELKQHDLLLARARHRAATELRAAR